MTIAHAKPTLIALLLPAVLTACVSQSKYDALQSRYDQLQAQNQATQQSLSRLQQTVRYVVNDDLAFKSGSWELSDAGQQTMARVAQQLAPFQAQAILINGYTDDAPIGAALRRQGVDTNAALSQRRADTVKAFLAQHGVRQDMMTTKGWGEQQPVASNDSVAGRAQNRRVEITFADQGATGSSAALP